MRLAGDAELDVGAIKKIFQEPPIIAEKLIVPNQFPADFPNQSSDGETW